MTSQAEKWRRHRQAFLLGRELGITPREAEAKMREMEAAAKARAAADARARLHAKMNPPLVPGYLQSARSDDRDPQPWMMRD